MDDQQIEQVITVGKKYPSLNIVKAAFEVEGEVAVIPSAIVTLTVKLHGVFGDNPDLVIPDEGQGDDGSDDKWWVDSNADQRDAYAPYFPVVTTAIDVIGS